MDNRNKTSGDAIDILEFMLKAAIMEMNQQEEENGGYLPEEVFKKREKLRSFLHLLIKKGKEIETR